MTLSRWLPLAAVALWGAPGTRTTVEQFRPNRDIDLGTYSLRSQGMESTGPSGMRLYVQAIPAPASTTDEKGRVFDAVIYLDSADQILKIRKKSGAVVSLE